MANITLTRGTTLPNSAAKSDFHNLVDTATGVTSNIVNADIDSAAAIVSSKLDLSALTQNLVMSNKIFKSVKGADVASVAGAITLGDDGNYFDITGTNAITSITAKTTGTFVILQFDSTASLVDGSNLKLQGNFTGVAEAQIMLVSDGSNWFEVARNLDFVPTSSNALAGSVVQVVNTLNTTMSTIATAIPYDDTIPQISEGGSVMSRAITPTNTSNKLLIRATVCWSNNTGATYNTLALFQDATANALACTTLFYGTGTQLPQISTLEHYMTAGTTSSTTFSLRLGDNSGNTITINGVNGARVYGGSLTCSLTVTEIKV